MQGTVKKKMHARIARHEEICIRTPYVENSVETGRHSVQVSYPWRVSNRRQPLR
ncbi:hypothetical protein M3J09_004032 [Ascochyta lentis]